MRPVVLVIAGFDTCAGAGIPADLESISQHGGYGIAALTSIVTQSASQVAHTQPVTATHLSEQIKFLLSQYRVSAIKIGLLPNAELIEACAETLQHHLPNRVPVILDPVIRASAGKTLMDEQALPSLQQLLALCSLLTPNLDEAQALHPKSPVLRELTSDELDAWALKFREQLPCDLLLKGGHLEGEFASDRLVRAEGIEHFSVRKINSPASHGTGCRLSSAIAALLARGESLSNAVEQAQKFVRHCLTHSIRLQAAAKNSVQCHLSVD